jgi:hypothetical protein
MNDKVKVVKPSSQELFLAKVQQNINSEGCWHWTGAKYLNGKGLVRRNGKNWLAHRLSYHLFVAPVQPGEDVRHTCTDSYCVNPEHLFKPETVVQVEDIKVDESLGLLDDNTTGSTGELNTVIITRSSDQELYGEEPLPSEGRPSAMSAFWAFRKQRVAANPGESMADTRSAWKEHKSGG